MKAETIKRFIFDRPYKSDHGPLIDRWLYGCIFLTTLYFTFALILIGVPELSKGGIVLVLLSVIWIIYGVTFRDRHFPLILYVPLFFYLIIFSFGFFVYYYPVVAVGKLTTAWLGAITIGVFVANGISLRFVVTCFFLIIVANLLAYSLGYDGRVVHVLAKNEYLYYDPDKKVNRVTALAGQTNLLVGFVFTFCLLYTSPSPRDRG